MATVVTVVTAAICFFCNGMMVGIIEQRCEEGSRATFKTEWKKEVEENQSSRLGRALMKCFYFIPSCISYFGR